MAGCGSAENISCGILAAGKGYMGKIDIVDRPYFSDRERFAELMNVALYHGERVLRPGDLVLRRGKYPALSHAYSEMERDVLMTDTRQNICYGIEIETESDYGMPVPWISRRSRLPGAGIRSRLMRSDVLLLA